MYFETTITPANGGFGEYQTNTPNGDGWEDESDLIAEMRGNEPSLVELGVDELPEGVEDIRGRIHNEPSRVFALSTDGFVNYFGIVER